MTSEQTFEETVVIAATSKGVWPFIPLGLLMTVLCLAVAVVDFERTTVFHRAVAWFGVVFFGYGFLLAIKQTLGWGLPEIRMTPDGFHATQVTMRPIPWTDIGGIGTWSFFGSTIIVVKVKENARRKAGMTWTAFLSWVPNRWLGIDGLAIGVSGMATSATQAVKLIRSYKRKVVHRRTAHPTPFLTEG